MASRADFSGLNRPLPVVSPVAGYFKAIAGYTGRLLTSSMPFLRKERSSPKSAIFVQLKSPQDTVPYTQTTSAAMLHELCTRIESVTKILLFFYT